MSIFGNLNQNHSSHNLSYGGTQTVPSSIGQATFNHQPRMSNIPRLSSSQNPRHSDQNIASHQQNGRSSKRQKSIILKIQESLTQHKTQQSNTQQQPQQTPMKRQQSNAHIKIVENNRDFESIAKQKKRENEVQINQETYDLLKDDYRYLMSFVMNQIDYMRTNVVQTGLTDEINMIFPTAEQMEKNWQNQHPAELCYVLKDYIKFFVRMNEKFISTKQEQIQNVDSRDEKQIILHNLELEKLQFGKKENEYLFQIEQLSKRKIELENKLQFMEKHCTDAINFLTKDNEQLINLVKDKDVVMDKIQEQIEIKNEHIRSQDQKLLSVLIYEFKLRKVDIKYQAQILKIMKQHSTDLEKYYAMLESCWNGLNKNGGKNTEDQLTYLKAYVQGTKNDLFNQIINVQSKYEKYADEFNDKKKNFNQLNEVQDKIKENQLFQNEDEIQKKSQSKFSKINFAQQLQNNIILNMNVAKKQRKRITRSIKDVQFMVNEQDMIPASKQLLSQNNLSQPSLQSGNNQYQQNNFMKANFNNEIKIQQQGTEQELYESINSPPKSTNITTKQYQQFFGSVKSPNQMLKSAINFNSTASSSTYQQMNANKDRNNALEQYNRKSVYSTKNNSTLQNFGSQQSIKNASQTNLQPKSSLIF